MVLAPAKNRTFRIDVVDTSTIWNDLLPVDVQSAAWEAWRRAMHSRRRAVVRFLDYSVSATPHKNGTIAVTVR